MEYYDRMVHIMAVWLFSLEKEEFLCYVSGGTLIIICFIWKVNEVITGKGVFHCLFSCSQSCIIYLFPITSA